MPKESTCIMSEKFDFIVQLCDEIFTCCDAMKLQAILASDERVKARFNSFAEDMYGTAVNIRSLADSCRQDVEGFEVHEDVLKEYGMDGYPCSR